MRIFFSVGRRAYAAGFAGLLVLLMFFSGQGVGRGAPAAGAPSKNLRYVFAHRYLPALLHEEPQLGLSLALAKQKQELLLKMWDLCRERYPDIPSEQPTGLSVVGERVEDGVVVALVTMPTPTETPEAYYACYIVRYTVGADKKAQATDVTYYTLEKTLSLESFLEGKKNTPPGGKDAKLTVIGGWTKDGSHLNFGDGPSPDSPNDFVGAVFKLYHKSGDKGEPAVTSKPGQ